MVQTILITLEKEDLQAIIIDCVNSCLKHYPTSPIPTTESDQLLSIKQASEFTGFTVQTLYAYVQRAEIPVNKRGGRLFFSKNELTEWVKGGKKKTNSELQAEAADHLSKKRQGR